MGDDQDEVEGEVFYGPDPEDIGRASLALERLKSRVASDYYMRLCNRVARWISPKPSLVATVLRIPVSKDVKRLAEIVGVAAARIAMTRDEYVVDNLMSASGAGTRRIQSSSDRSRARIIQLQEALLAHYIEKPKESGRAGRNARWAARDKAHDRAIELWKSRAWNSKQQCAQTIAPEIEQLAKDLGSPMSPSNAEKTVYKWLQAVREPSK